MIYINLLLCIAFPCIISHCIVLLYVMFACITLFCIIKSGASFFMYYSQSSVIRSDFGAGVEGVKGEVGSEKSISHMFGICFLAYRC